MTGREVMAKRRSRHKDTVETIRKFITLLGGTCNVLHQVGRLRGSAGIPDLFIQVEAANLSYWHEVKVGKDTLSPAQGAFLEREERCGGLMAVGGLDATCRLIEGQRPAFWKRHIVSDLTGPTQRGKLKKTGSLTGKA